MLTASAVSLADLGKVPGMAALAQAMAGGRLAASADFLGNGAIETNRYETEIFDLVRRASLVLPRLHTLPATGHPHRFFEQTAIATASTTDPRNISPSATSPTRVEKSAPIKAAVAQTNLSIFDVDVTRQQGQFAYVEAKDIEDIINAIELLRGQMLWAGTDTSFSSPTTTQWFGLLAQITNALNATIAIGASIIDGLKGVVAALVAQQGVVVRPTAIMLNPVLGDYIDREAKASHIELGTMSVTAGVTVNKLSTQAGDLPLIPDPLMPTTTDTSFGFTAPPSGFKNYPAVILMEREVEIPYIHGGDQNPKPRLFQLGLLGGLQGQYVGLKFDSVIAKGPTYAHAIAVTVRP
jgi:hypothetical protein